MTAEPNWAAGPGALTLDEWQASSPLFDASGHPKPGDGKQYALDCDKIALLSSMAANNPDHILKQVRRNDDGSFAVTFFKNVRSEGTKRDSEEVIIRPEELGQWGAVKTIRETPHCEVRDPVVASKMMVNIPLTPEEYRSTCFERDPIWKLVIEAAYFKLRNNPKEANRESAFSLSSLVAMIRYVSGPDTEFERLSGVPYKEIGLGKGKTNGKQLWAQLLRLARVPGGEEPWFSPLTNAVVAGTTQRRTGQVDLHSLWWQALGSQQTIPEGQGWLYGHAYGVLGIGHDPQLVSEGLSGQFVRLLEPNQAVVPKGVRADEQTKGRPFDVPLEKFMSVMDRIYVPG